VDNPVARPAVFGDVMLRARDANEASLIPEVDAIWASGRTSPTLSVPELRLDGPVLETPVIGSFRL
jgi:hypothetical protein